MFDYITATRVAKEKNIEEVYFPFAGLLLQVFIPARHIDLPFFPIS
jgi:hypothetical protein